MSLLRVRALFFGGATIACMIALAPPAWGYEVIKVTNGGSIEGTVKLAGAVPALPALKVTKNQPHCGQTLPDPTYAVRADGALANVEVFLKGVVKGKATAANEVAVFTNAGCMFKPRVMGAQTGEQIKVVSDDPIAHNTHILIDGSNTSFGNFAMPFKGFTLTKTLPATPDLLRVKCDIHGWMKAWIWVFDHPYFATTGPDGSFRLDDVPPGTYVLVAWHEALGQTQETITVQAGKSAAADLTFKSK